MSKERKVRNFDFLKETPPPLPSREEVIQKTAELTGQSAVGEEKEKKEVKKRQKAVELPSPPIVVQEIVAKSKVGRRALIDSRKPFTTTITVDNKRRLRQLCAEHDIAMSDVINEILSAHFDQRTPIFN